MCRLALRAPVAVRYSCNSILLSAPCPRVLQFFFSSEAR